ncbi:Modification methylase EcoRI [uncultured Candidatus Thioglobus sp.]|nr:Modification methylase EcoRI [uncultured Candidatus Thioglobus sp.]
MDIIITNPPFSLFREFLAWLMKYDKQFLMIGNMNAVTYKEVFPFIKNNRLWLGNGFNSGNAYFQTPVAKEYAGGVYNPETGLVKFRNCIWFTNIEHGRRHELLTLMTMADNLKFNNKIDSYPKYDNYDAIEVSYTKAIPSDYKGVMGVPISFMDKYCPEQFEILGATESEGKGFSNGLWSEKSKVSQPLVNQKRVYKRIFIKNKQL